MMMQRPRDMAPTRMASAMLCSCTISFQRWYGVSLSISMKAITKIKIPTNANTGAATMLPSGTRFILFASGVVVLAAVNRAVRTAIIADGFRDVLELVDGDEAPAAVLTEGRDAENQES